MVGWQISIRLARTPVARELAPAGWRSRPNRNAATVQADRISRFTTAAQPSGSKLPRHRSRALRQSENY
nr:hypothetical protein C1892_19165 [Pseudomonas sp. MPBD7-1]